jgi:hypothetical protein
MRAMKKYRKIFIRMDVHKDSIDVRIARFGEPLRRLGAIAGDRVSLHKMVRKQQTVGRTNTCAFATNR